MLYDIGFFLFSIFYLPALIFKGKLHKDFLERFGIFDKDKRAALTSGKNKIWIEAVSVGEVSLCKVLIPRLRERYPEKEIVVSTITKTGNDLARVSLSGVAAVIYFPLDLSFITRRVVAIIRPEIYIMIETEIWPNLLKALSDSKIPSVLVNGRISDRSFGKYRLVKPFLKRTLERISIFCMRSGLDGKRIIEMGAPKDKVMVTGNMKFDIGAMSNVGTGFKAEELLDLSQTDKLFVAGSTHEHEEDVILDVFKKLSREFPELRLLIAPRHIDRAVEVAGTVKRFGFEPVKVSALKEAGAPDRNPRVMILDTIGRLNDIYALATLVFIGGSLVKYGGHNPIEPAIFGKPVIFGPHMFNFSDTALIFLSGGAALEAKDAAELFNKCVSLLKDEKRRLNMGENGRKLISENSGATARNLKAMAQVLIHA